MHWLLEFKHAIKLWRVTPKRRQMDLSHPKW
jgi:hypothetical protein